MEGKVQTLNFETKKPMDSQVRASQDVQIMLEGWEKRLLG